MHKFLRAAGFSEIKEAEVYRFIWQQVVKPENVTAKLDIDKETVLFEYRLAVNSNIGICAAIACIADEYRELRYYYPYYSNRETSSDSDCIVEGHTNGDTFSGILDEEKIGLSLIFFLTNPIQYRQNPDIEKQKEYKGARLSAFADEGIVILPVQKPQKIITDRAVGEEREKLIEAAMDGDTYAIETLTASDMDMYQQISERMENEDLYSVVDQSFMPCGVECDQYSIIGEILEVEESANSLTDEKLWLLKLTCNDVEFRLCIRQADLTGEPMRGRRIKCRLWMQGSVNVCV